MSKKIKFKYKELKELNKVIVWVDYIDRDFFNNDFKDCWKYNNIDFTINTYCNIENGDFYAFYTEKQKFYKFVLHLGLKENIFVVNKDKVKYFKDLENIVYNIQEQKLTDYLNDNKYYFIGFDGGKFKFSSDWHYFEKDKVDKEHFETGNIFNSLEEVLEIVDNLNSNELTLKNVINDRKEFFKNYKFK